MLLLYFLLFFYGDSDTITFTFLNTYGCDLNQQWELESGFEKGIQLGDITFFDLNNNIIPVLNVHIDNPLTVEPYVPTNLFDSNPETKWRDLNFETTCDTTQTLEITLDPDQRLNYYVFTSSDSEFRADPIQWETLFCSSEEQECISLYTADTEFHGRKQNYSPQTVIGYQQVFVHVRGLFEGESVQIGSSTITENGIQALEYYQLEATTYKIQPEGDICTVVTNSDYLVGVSGVADIRCNDWTFPTVSPTEYPTGHPHTTNPTKNPSFSPTVTPTDAPSDIPTISEPTNIPTVTPSDAPTTLAPSLSPETSRPTSTPETSIPTRTPSAAPTVYPSDHPTVLPTDFPTFSDPTYLPSVSPTVYPSVVITFTSTRGCDLNELWNNDFFTDLLQLSEITFYNSEGIPLPIDGAITDAVYQDGFGPNNLFDGDRSTNFVADSWTCDTNVDVFVRMPERPSMFTLTTAEEGINRDPTAWLITLTSHAEGSVTVPYQQATPPGRAQNYDLMDLSVVKAMWLTVTGLNVPMAVRLVETLLIDSPGTYKMQYGLFTGDPYLLFVEGDACVVTSDEDSFQYFVEQSGQNIYSGVVGNNDIYINFDCTWAPSLAPSTSTPSVVPSISTPTVGPSHAPSNNPSLMPLDAPRCADIPEFNLEVTSFILSEFQLQQRLQQAQDCAAIFQNMFQSAECDIRLVKQDSSSPCLQDLTYGCVDRRTMYVDAGCAGNFKYSGFDLKCESSGFAYTECSIPNDCACFDYVPEDFAAEKLNCYAPDDLYNSIYDRWFDCQPTQAPTAAPHSSAPSHLPSNVPTTSCPSTSPVTSAPTQLPSQNPVTSNPTPNPSTSMPTGIPSFKPTGTPTKTPTGFPTRPPTQHPHSSPPSGTPSSAPTRSRGLQIHFTQTRGCDQNDEWGLAFGFDNGIALGEMKFYDIFGNPLSSEIVSEGAQNPEGKEFDNLMDGDVESYWQDSRFDSTETLEATCLGEVLIYLPDMIDLEVYQFFTAGTNQYRDPTSWYFELCLDDGVCTKSYREYTPAENPRLGGYITLEAFGTEVPVLVEGLLPGESVTVSSYGSKRWRFNGLDTLDFTLFPGQSWDITVDNPNCFVVNGKGTMEEDFSPDGYAAWVRCNTGAEVCDLNSYDEMIQFINNMGDPVGSAACLNLVTTIIVGDEYSGCECFFHMDDIKAEELFNCFVDPTDDEPLLNLWSMCQPSRVPSPPSLSPTNKPSISSPTVSPTTPRPTVSQPTVAPSFTAPSNNPTLPPVTSSPSVPPTDHPTMPPSFSFPSHSPSLHPTHSPFGVFTFTKTQGCVLNEQWNLDSSIRGFERGISLSEIIFYDLNQNVLPWTYALVTEYSDGLTAEPYNIDTLSDDNTDTVFLTNTAFDATCQDNARLEIYVPEDTYYFTFVAGNSQLTNPAQFQIERCSPDCITYPYDVTQAAGDVFALGAYPQMTYMTYTITVTVLALTDPKGLTAKYLDSVFLFEEDDSKTFSVGVLHGGSYIVIVNAPNSCSSYNAVGDNVLDDVTVYIDCSSKPPTGKPSQSPIGFPSPEPTLIPTGFPSTKPTNDPSRSPTRRPFGPPTPEPSFKPTGTPSTAPSDAPTRSPSNAPTSTPSDYPSPFPSVAPSLFPTRFPTGVPTHFPSLSPTGPSEPPSTIPTASPTCPATGKCTCPLVDYVSVVRTDDIGCGFCSCEAPDCDSPGLDSEETIVCLKKNARILQYEIAVVEYEIDETSQSTRQSCEQAKTDITTALGRCSGGD